MTDRRKFRSHFFISRFAILVKKVEIEHLYKNKGNSLNFYKNSKKQAKICYVKVKKTAKIVDKIARLQICFNI